MIYKMELITVDKSIVRSEGCLGDDGIESASNKKDTKTFRQTGIDAFR